MSDIAWRQKSSCNPSLESSCCPSVLASNTLTHQPRRSLLSYLWCMNISSSCCWRKAVAHGIALVRQANLSLRFCSSLSGCGSLLFSWDEKVMSKPLRIAFNCKESPDYVTPAPDLLQCSGPGLDGKSVADLILEHKVSVTAAVPTVISGLLEHCEASHVSLRGVLRLCCIGGAACPPVMMDKLIDTHGVQVGHMWGNFLFFSWSCLLF